MGVPAASDTIISALTPCAQHILLCLILERDTRVEEVEEDEELEEEEGRKKWGVNRSLIQHIPSLDSCALLNKAFDTGCYWS